MALRITIGNVLTAMVPLAAYLAFDVHMARMAGDVTAALFSVVLLTPFLVYSGCAVASNRRASFLDASMQIATVPCVLMVLMQTTSTVAWWLSFALLGWIGVWRLIRRTTTYRRLPASVFLLAESVGFGLVNLALLFVPPLLFAVLWVAFVYIVLVALGIGNIVQGL